MELLNTLFATVTHSQTHESFNNNIAFEVTYLLFSLIIYQVITAILDPTRMTLPWKGSFTTGLATTAMSGPEAVSRLSMDIDDIVC